MDSDRGDGALPPPGYPIRASADHSWPAAPRGLSQPSRALHRPLCAEASTARPRQLNCHSTDRTISRSCFVSVLRDAAPKLGDATTSDHAFAGPTGGSGAPSAQPAIPSSRPQLPLRPPCYVFIPVGTQPWTGAARLRVGHFPARDVQSVRSSGTYSPRYADPRLLAASRSRRRVAACDPHWGRFCGIAPPRGLASLCTAHCSACVAQGIRAAPTRLHPHLPPGLPGSLARERRHPRRSESSRSVGATGDGGFARLGTGPYASRHELTTAVRHLCRFPPARIVALSGSYSRHVKPW